MTRNIKDLFNVNGKIALVTGGAKGIGAMITRGLVANGAKVYVCGREKEALDSLSNEIGCIPIVADLSKESDIINLVNSIPEDHLDILVNNAGVTWGESIETYPDKAFEKVLNVNVKKVFMLIRLALPLLKKSGTRSNPARIINIGSIDGIRVPRLETYAYSASKAALLQLTRVLAFQLAEKNISVNLVAPGPFESKMMAATLKKHRKDIEQGIPFKRIGEPEDIVGVILFLSSDASSYVTGATIPVDGGILIRGNL